MVVSKQTQRLMRYPLAVYATPAERDLINSYFAANPALKKGETFKKWILERLRQEARE